MDQEKTQKVENIAADKIIEPVEAMRTEMDRDKVYELAESIKTQGLINPLTVRPVGDKYEIVAGHRRFKACAIAGVFIIPCVIREMTNQEVFALRAHENLFRDDIDPVDEAVYVGKLIGEDEAKIAAVAKMLNRSTTWVEDRLAILQYPDNFLPHLKNGTLKLGVAKALAQVGDTAYREMWLDSALRDGMSVWQADYYASQWKAGIYKNSADILPPDPNSDRPQAARVQQPCAKCGKMAINPNLTNVFIHVECPPDETPTS